MLPRISRVECKDADYLLFSTDDVISNTLFREGGWSDNLLGMSKFIVSDVQNPLVLDIGANLGAYSIPMAKSMQDQGGSVLAFEPQRIVFYQLCANVILNRLDNVHAIYGAVGKSKCEIEVPEINYELNANAGAFSLSQKYREIHGIEGSMKQAKNKVQMINLDGLDVDRPPALIKIDVEGFELEVISGAVEFLGRTNYPTLIFEAWDFEWFREGREELLAYVKSLGYEITRFGNTDYMAQHPKNSMGVEVTSSSDGVVKIVKAR